MKNDKIFIGIDLAWTENNETGLCFLNNNGEILYLKSRVYHDDEILSLVLNQLILSSSIYVGIDAPLIFPDNEKEYRKAERELKKSKINGFSISSFQVSRDYMNRVYKGSRGEKITKAIIEKGPKFQYTKKLFSNKYELIETFPTGIIAGVFPDIFHVKYKLKGRIVDAIKGYNILYEKLYELEKLKIIKNFSKEFSPIKEILSGKEYKHIEDKLDSFLCALSMFLVYKNICSDQYFGDLEDGIIFLPINN